VAILMPNRIWRRMRFWEAGMEAGLVNCPVAMPSACMWPHTLICVYLIFLVRKLKEKDKTKEKKKLFTEEESFHDIVFKKIIDTF
jgi:hypothetical protein